MIVGLGPMSRLLGRSAFAAAFSPSRSVTPLDAPANLFTAAQASFATSSHIDLRSNWTVGPSALSQIVGNGSTNTVRLSMDAPTVAGNPHFMRIDLGAGTPAGNIRLRFGGSGLATSFNHDATQDRQVMQWSPGAEIAAAYPYLEIRPDSDAFAQTITSVEAYDLAATDPTQVACDVVLCLGDSNMSNAVSEFVTQANMETAFDGRVWVMPCLRTAPNTFTNTMSVRHVPQPCHEPVQSASSGFRMSPLMAFGARFVPWSGARGRPLLLLSLGDPGSGLNGTEDWRKTSAEPTTGARMYDELLAALAALDALGPAHQIVGALVSLGANDTTAADYDVVWTPLAQQFVSDLRADTGVANLPICWITPGEHYDPTPGETRGARMIAAIEGMDADSGGANAVANLVSVRPPTGNELTDETDPHFTAAGMQANGRAMADALLGIV